MLITVYGQSEQQRTIRQKRKIPPAEQTKILVQQAINELLKSGMSYLQIMLKYNACKSMFPKGTPEFYTCMTGKPPPPSLFKQQQQQQQQQKKEEKKTKIIIVQVPTQQQQQQQKQQQQKQRQAQQASMLEMQKKMEAERQIMIYTAIAAFIVFVLMYKRTEEEKK